MDSDDYIPLKDDYVKSKQPIAIFGYPGNSYKKINKKNDEAVTQWGLMYSDRVLEVR